MHRIGTLLARNGEINLRKADVAAYSLLPMLSDERIDPLPEMMQNLLNTVHFNLDKCIPLRI